MWHVTCDTWHVTRDCDMWHVTRLGGWTFSQNFSSLALTVCDLWYYEDLEERDDSITEYISDEAVYRTALPTPGLLKIKLWHNSKTQIVSEIKNSNCDKTQQLKLWPNSKTQNVTKLKISNCDKTQKLKLWQNSKTQIVTKLKNSNYEKT